MTVRCYCAPFFITIFNAVSNAHVLFFTLLTSLYIFSCIIYLACFFLYVSFKAQDVRFKLSQFGQMTKEEWSQ